MSLERLNPGPIVRAHVKALTRADRPGRVADRGARWTEVLSLLIIAPAQIFDWRLSAPDALLAGVALLAGALLSAFGYLATVRLRLQDRDPSGNTGTQRAKDLLDESVAHLLIATLACLLDAVLLVIGMNLSKDGQSLTGPMAAVTIGVSSYIAVVFLMLVTRLYATYVDAVKPRRELNGLIVGGGEG